MPIVENLSKDNFAGAMDTNMAVRRILGILNENGLSYNTQVTNSQNLDAIANSTIIPSSEPMVHNQVVVGDTPTVVVAGNPSRKEVAIQNTHATAKVYIGSSSVSASNGFPLAPSQTIILAVTGAIYAVTASGSLTVAYLEVL